MRPKWDEYFLKIAQVVSTRATCGRRKVGCVLVDGRMRVLSTGYNGRPSSWRHCFESPCKAAKAKSGCNLDGCEAIHAEQNALIQCPDSDEIVTCYVTVSPCVHCVKMLLNTSCSRIVFLEEYPHEEAKELWTRDGRQWKQLSLSS